MGDWRKLRVEKCHNARFLSLVGRTIGCEDDVDGTCNTSFR